MKDLILVCDDQFGAEVWEIINQINIYNERQGKKPAYRITGYLSDTEHPFGNLMVPIKRLGTIREWVPQMNERFVLGICNPDFKAYAVRLLNRNDAGFETIITPWMIAPRQLDIGEGSIVSAYTVKAGIKIGKYVTVLGSMLSNHEIGNYSTVMRFSNVAGNRVGEKTYVGNHVFLAVGKNIGDHCVVCDGSIVVKSVKDNMRVDGVPAKKTACQ